MSTTVISRMSSILLPVLLPDRSAIAAACRPLTAPMRPRLPGPALAGCFVPGPSSQPTPAASLQSLNLHSSMAACCPCAHAILLEQTACQPGFLLQVGDSLGWQAVRHSTNFGSIWNGADLPRGVCLLPAAVMLAAGPPCQRLMYHCRRNA